MRQNTRQRYCDYKISHLQYSQHETCLGIGYILQCNKGDSFGMVYGYHDHGRTAYREKTWIYYFKKTKSFAIAQFTEVSYLKSSSGYDKKESYEVSNITPLSCYAIIDTKNKEIRGQEKKRQDGIYHFDNEWNLMCQSKPYIDLWECAINVYYPVVNNRKKTIIFHDYTVYTRNKRDNIISCFIGMHDLCLYSTEPKFEYVSSKLDEIKEYITNFNLSSCIKTFIAGQSGFFKCYPGRDDSFFITDYWRTKSKDSYMKQLVNLHEDERYYNCYGQGKDEEDYDRINIEETKTLRAEVKKKYDRDAHYMFLVKEFFDELRKQREMYLLYKEDISCFIEQGDEDVFNKTYDEAACLNLVESYNKKKG